jgi:hypothetical protein
VRIGNREAVSWLRDRPGARKGFPGGRGFNSRVDTLVNAMTSPSTLLGPRLKLRRAERHIEDLAAKVDDYLSSEKSFRLGEKSDPASGCTRTVVLGEEPPYELPLIAGDAVHNLRSALDLLVWQLVLANDGTPSERDAFPIAKDSAAYVNRANEALAQVSDAARSQIDLLKPYDGGNDDLWHVHRLDIADKHRLLLVVARSLDSVTLTTTLPDGTPHPGSTAYFQKGAYFPLRDGMEIPEIDTLKQAYAASVPWPVEPDFKADVAFGDESKYVHGQRLVPTLKQLAKSFDKIVESFAPLLS